MAGSSASEVSAAVPENESPATIPTADVSAAMATNEVFSGIPVTSEFVQVTEIILPLMSGKILRADLLFFKFESIFGCPYYHNQESNVL